VAQTRPTPNPEPEDEPKGPENGKNRGREDPGPQGIKKPAHLRGFPDPDKEGADYRGNNAGHGQQDRQAVGRLAPGGNGRQGQGRHNRPDVRLKKVSPHPGHVAHVVADIVGNHRRVSGVVFGDTGLDLADQVSPHIRRLGVNSAPNPGEEGDGRGPEAEPGDNVRVANGQKEGREAQNPEADHGDAHNRPAGEGDPQGIVKTAGGGGRRPDVRPDGHIHPDKAGQGRAEGPDQVAEGGQGMDNQAENNGDNNRKGDQRPVLPQKEGHRPHLNRPGDIHHLRPAGVLL